MYKVLYRKYRPRVFADVVGQPQVTVTLKNELMRGRISHAYLFTGSRGTGKTTCAKILARAVNCLRPVDGDPCGECEICRGLEDGSLLDVMEIDAASNNGVENVRAIIEETSFTPARAKYRVYIIDEVHMLSPAAFNALLKTLEEPPAHVVFILATTEVHKLLPTILSRCQRFDFHRIDPELMAARLEQVSGLEGARLDQEAALLIARTADGALRDALSLLDQCLGRGTHITLETVYETAGLAARDYLGQLARAVAERDPAAALGVIDRLYRESKDLSRLCAELAEYFRGLLLYKTMKDPGPLLQVSPAEREELSGLSGAMSLATVLHCLDALEEALNKMRLGNQRTQLEIALVRLCSPQLDTTPESLLRRIEALESGTALHPPRESAERPEPHRDSDFDLPPAPEPPPPAEPAPEPAPIPKAAPAPKAPPAPNPRPAADPGVEELMENAKRFGAWPDILQQLSAGSKSVAMAFEGSSAYISGDYMLIDAPEIAFDLLKKSDQRTRLREAISRVTGRAYKLGPYKRAGEGAKTDPMDELLRRAREAGIPVEET
ncbi:DNA polymerase III subunit gamma/tau [Acutalibacter muris]|jgi:DNA polymerase-3 subunit gamma/tau|uniref:DNA polymerase III subunit gamma/tau n=1 Tax=Acutalibacter muris TaxID=1796620 RepID=UPI0026F388AA|nr:DNA polymerase III subunit gamma/tau [Acutalibacter muris]